MPTDTREPQDGKEEQGFQDTESVNKVGRFHLGTPEIHTPTRVASWGLDSGAAWACMGPEPQGWSNQELEVLTKLSSFQAGPSTEHFSTTGQESPPLWGGHNAIGIYNHGKNWQLLVVLNG